LQYRHPYCHCLRLRQPGITFFISKFPEVKKIESWQKTYLEVWEDTIDGLDADEEYKTERRETLVKTFERFITLAKQYEENS
jgi:hypothetical protein